MEPTPPRSRERPTVSVIIVGYGTLDELRACLPGVLAEGRTTPIEVIVVENASGDGTAEHIPAEFPDVRFVELDENVGFARAVNHAASMATGRYRLLLNPDMVIEPGLIAALVDCARRHPEAGIVGGRTTKPDGTNEPSSCWGAPSWWSQICFATGLSTAFPSSERFDPESLGSWRRDDEREVGMITGCLLLASEEVWDELGGFDERYWMYGEDADLSMRARAHGYRPRITPDAVAMHSIGASSRPDDRRVMVLKGKATLLRTHFDLFGGRVATALIVGGVGLRAGLSLTLSVVGRGDSTESWRAAWRRRDEWTNGYPDARDI